MQTVDQTEAGRIINDRYRLDAVIGQGGMGAVYRSYDTLLERIVAVKLLTDTGLGSEGRARLLNEARAAARLNHPNIVSVYDAGQADKSPFIVMELVSGVSLYELHPANLVEVISIVGQICAALDHAHTNGIIHRDLKPENVLVTPAGVAKLTDFGLARSLTSRITGSGAVSGTVLYMAPEMALNQPVDGRTDLYALGVILYELVCGRLPFNADNPLAVISQHIHAQVVPPSKYRSDLPAGLESVILKLLAKEPDRRFQTAQDVLQALDLVENQPGAVVYPPLHEIKDVDALLEQLARGRLVGRRDELDTLHRLWVNALGGRAYLALISGEPGIGKTRLANEIIVDARLSNAVVLRGGSYEYETASPYLPIVEALREWVRCQSDEELRRSLEAQAVEIAKLAPEVETRLGPLDANPPLEANDERLRLYDNIARFFQRLAAKSGLLLFIDDIHWADQGTLSLLHYLLRHLRQDRFMVVACYREVELDRQHAFAASLVDWNRERLATRISLSRLDIKEVGQLLASLFTQERLSDEFTEAIFRETEGNPFFIEEVIKSLIEQGQIYWEDGKWQRREITELAIPQSIKEAVGRRLNRQSSASIEMLHSAAVLGKRFSFAELQTVAGQAENDLLDALDEASNAQLLRAEGGETFAFTHDKIREVLYEELNPIRRRRLHLRIGVGLEQLYGLAGTNGILPISGGDGQARATAVESLAHHFIEGGDLAKGMDYSIRAGDIARRVFALDEAVHGYQHAIDCAEILQDNGQLAKLYETLGAVQEQRGMVQASTESFEHALELVESPNERARLKTMLGAVYAQIGDERGRAHLLAALDDLDPHSQARDVARANAILGRYYHLHAEWDIAIQYLERARQIAEPLNDPPAMVEIYAYLAGAYQQSGNFETSMEWARQSIAHGERYGILASVALGQEFLSEDYLATGRYHQALQHGELDLQIGEKIGSLARQAWAIYSLAGAYHGLGQLEKALQTANDCLQIVDRTGEHRLEALIRTTRANIYADLDDFEAAWNDANYVVQRAEITGQGQLYIWGVDVRVNLFTYQERWQELLDLISQVKGELRDRYVGHYFQALIQLDRRQELLSRMEGWDRPVMDVEEGHSPWYWYVIALTGVYLGEREGAAASFDKAISLFEAREERISLGRALHQRAIYHQKVNEMTLARQDIQRAIDLFTGCGAKFHLSAAEKFMGLLPA